MKTNGIILLAVLFVAGVLFVGDVTDEQDFGMPWYGGGDFPSWAGQYGGEGWKNFMHYTNVVCKEKGACFNKKLTCPDKCFHFKETNGKKHGGGGGCSFDYTKCKAVC